MRKNELIKNQQGSSLTSLLVGIAVALIIIVGAFFFYVQIKKTEVSAISKDSFETAHEQAVNVFRNLRTVQNLISSNIAFSNCLQADYGTAASCPAFETTPYPLLLTASTAQFKFTDNPANSPNNKPKGNFTRLYPLISGKKDRSGRDCTNNCYIEISSYIQGVRCDKPTRCQSVRFTVKTKVLNPANTNAVGSAKDKETDVNYSAAAIIQSGDIEFNKDGCLIPQGAPTDDSTYLTGLNYELRKGNCEGPVPPAGPAPFTQCPNKEPMNSYYQPGTTSCAKLIKQTGCATGLKTVGVFDGQGACTPTPTN